MKLYGTRGLDHEPGKQDNYSNYGFVLLGEIIERVSGMSYYDYVEQHIFKVSGALLHEATEPQNNGRWYGYGFMVSGGESPRYYGHEGGAPGMNGNLRIFPDLGVVIVVLSNLDPPAADRLMGFYSLRMPISP